MCVQVISNDFFESETLVFQEMNVSAAVLSIC